MTLMPKHKLRSLCMAPHTFKLINVIAATVAVWPVTYVFGDAYGKMTIDLTKQPIILTASKTAVPDDIESIKSYLRVREGKKSESVGSETEEPTLGEPLPARPTYVPLASVGKLGFGDYHALVIGNNSYQSVSQLKTAVNDAKSVAELLRKEYGFKVKLLLDATRNQMLDAFDGLRKTLTEKDNLLIYYAGHGHLDRDSDRGFWLPVDADRDRRANWLSNSDIADMVRATRAKHVLVVADSCYAGTLTRSLTVQLTGVDNLSRLAQKRARTVLTSGGLEPVEDSGGGQHSVFAKAFLDSLRANNGAVDMSQIFASMRRQVMLGSEQTPQYGDIRQVGHEGGDFIFVRRRTGN